MRSIYTRTQPKQRLPFKKKTKAWRKDNVDHGDKASLYHNEGVRQSLRNKVINLNLYNGIVNVDDMRAIVNPSKTKADYIPDNIPHHPILVPKVDLLAGEEIKRRFDYKVVVTNPDAITAKESQRKDFLFKKIAEFLQQNYSEEELEGKMAELERYMKYEWQDLHEKMANQIIKHYWEEQRFGLIFNEGFKDVMTMAEEIYQVSIISNEPTLHKLNPLKVRTVGSGKSNRIEDADVIIIEDHWNPSRIIDTFYEDLKPKDIDYITNYTSRSGEDANYTDDDNNHLLLRDQVAHQSVEEFMTLAEINGHEFGSDYTDADGNVRVLRVYWKSLKKIQKVKYYDEYGDVDYKIRSEEYIVNTDAGEEAKTLWVNEIWEGTKIGRDVYIQMKPCDVQYTRMNNPSRCHAGIIGQIYNTNQGRGVSIMDRGKNHQYMYDAIKDRLNKAIAANYGKIMPLDIARIPNNWEVDKWMHFATVNKIAVYDSFKEGNRGAATGKLAGSMQQSSGVLDMETGNYIQQHIQLLEYIRAEIGEITGVSEQRQGQISNRETVGGIERAVNQSSHITEYWFTIHDEVKIRVLTAFLEAAKIALKGVGNKKAQYILDDMTIQVLNIDTDSFCDADYGVVSTNSSKSIELESMMKQSAQAFMQNGGGLSTIMDIYLSDSLSDMRRKIEMAETDINNRNAKQAEDANKVEQARIQQELQIEQMKLELEREKNIRDNNTKLQVAELGKDSDRDGIVENTSDDGKLQLEKDKFNFDKQVKSQDIMLKIKSLQNDMVKHKDDLAVKNKAVNKSSSVSK